MTHNSKNNVSIRLMSGGHSSFLAQLNLFSPACQNVQVEVITAKTIIRPAEGFDVSSAQHDLESTGYSIATNECVVCSGEVDNKVAIMSIDAECYRSLLSLGANISFITPLLGEDLQGSGVVIDLISDVLYVRIYRDELCFAEAMTVVNDADLLFYLENINRVYGIYNMNARARGDVERIKRVCKRLFKTIAY